MSVDISDDANLDTILTEVGAFGLFHVFAYLLLIIPNIIYGATNVNYLFAAANLDYRCKVPGCDIGANHREIPYDQPWLSSAIPFSNNKIDRCHRFAPRKFTTKQDGECSAYVFDNTTKIPCTEFIYASDEINIQTEFNIHCSDSYKLALVGTMSGVGRFLFLPFTGLLSDKFGRLTVMICGMMLCSVFGLIKSFATNYLMFIALEFLESSAGTCTYSATYVLGIELVSSHYRVLGGVLASLSHPIGEMLLGLLVMYVHDFRTVLRFMYLPGLSLFILFWAVPESVRWLLITGRVDRAVRTLKRIAKVNRKKLSEKSIDIILRKYSNEITTTTSSTEVVSLFQSFLIMFKSKTLSQRFFIGCYQWVAGCFYYYGLNISATYIPGLNRYTSFIVVVAIEVPAILLALPLINRFNRRIALFAMFAISAVSIFITPFIPEEHSTIVLILFVVGKGSVTIAFEVLYIFTAEQWPTNLRTTIMNSCSMMGRIGLMVAPLAVILGSQHGSLPALLFGGSALIAAVSVVFCPETYGKRLPDTFREAKEI